MLNEEKRKVKFNGLFYSMELLKLPWKWEDENCNFVVRLFCSAMVTFCLMAVLMVLYMFLAVGSWVTWCFSNQERKKELLAKLSKFIKWQLHIFTQNGPRLSLRVKIVVIMWIFSTLQAVLSFFLSMRKITWLKSQQPKTRGHVEHLYPHLWAA